MLTKVLRRRKKSGDSKSPEHKKKRRRVVQRLVEDDLIQRVSYEQYREKVLDVYGGAKGVILPICSTLSLHLPLGGRLFSKRKFDLRGAARILDCGSGAGQIVTHLLKYADPGATITCFDLSVEMLKRARNRLRGKIPDHVAADLTKLPLADNTFDCVTCSYVLEHLPDPRVGLAELARVMKVGGRMFLLTTEDTFSGAWTSRLFCCRTYNRAELKKVCEEVGFQWGKELWLSPVHRALRAGGICVELTKLAAGPA